MTVIERSALLPYPADAMYQLVNDIEAYPKYMEGCVGAHIIERTPEHIEARLDLAKGGVRHSFTTRNRLLPPQRIELSLVEGPFESFGGEWTFDALNERACKVTLRLHFKMASRLLGFAAKAMFSGVANQLVDALVKRANAVYGAGR